METLMVWDEVPNRTIAELDQVLEREDIDVNEIINEETILLNSLGLNRSDAFIIRLLNVHAEVNQCDFEGGTPLAAALRRSTLIVAQEMLNKGAHLNDALCEVASSPNYYNPAALSFLLYHGANVNEAILMTLLSSGNESAAELVLNYYGGSLYRSLYCAIENSPNIAFKLIEMGANVNYVPFEGLNMLELCLRKGHAALFKCIWKRFDYNIIIGTSFLSKFFECFGLLSSDEWMDCLMLILTSSVAPELAEFKFFEYFFKRCKNKNDRPNLSDRLRIIYLALSLNFKVLFDDIVAAHDIFGFNEELEILIYFIKYQNVSMYRYFHESDYLLPFYLGIQDDLNECHMWSIQGGMCCGHFRCSRYFSRSCYTRCFASQSFLRKIKSLPQLPSLFQLSRTGARKFIRQAYNVKEPYQFHDAVRGLNLPQYIEDVIRFKTPIYL